MDNETTLSRDEVFLKKVIEAIQENLANEHFGVAELSHTLAISRFQLLRKVKSLKGKSVNQLIREVRLDEARKMLVADVATVAEIAYRVGFNSPSYFNKCFHDLYGYAPGEARRKAAESNDGRPDAAPSSDADETQTTTKHHSWMQFSKKKTTVAALFITVCVALYAISQAGFFGSDNPRQVSIAILPLDNLTGSDEETYLVSGIHDALIGKLGQISSLRVISRTSTLRYPKSKMLLQDIARELDVDVIVEGSVFRSGDSLRIQLQLIEAFPNERHLWAKEYHEDIRKALAIHSNVVHDIAREIQVSLTNEEESRLSHTRLVDPETYRAYLRGMFYLSQPGTSNIDKAIWHFRDAIDKNGDDPLPWAGLAIAYSTLGHGSNLVADPFADAKAAAKKALSIDASLAEAHLALAMIALYHDWDWSAAEQGFTRALEINPNLALAHTHYAWFEMLFGRVDDVLYHGKKATELDPFSAVYSAYLACEYWWLGQDAQALQQIEEAVKLAPENGFVLYVQGAIYSAIERHADAIAVHQKAVGVNTQWRWCLAHTYLAASRQEETIKLADEIKVAPGPMDTWGLAEIYATTGDIDEAFKWLEEGYKVRFSWVPWVAWNPNYKSLRSDPRLDDLLQRMDLPSRNNAITAK